MDDKNESKVSFKCVTCQYYDKSFDICQAQEITECSEKNIQECESFLIKDKLVMF